MSSTTSPVNPDAGPIQSPVTIHKIPISCIPEVLRQGLDDLRHSRTDALLTAVIFPVAGLLFAAAFIIQGLLPFIFPLLSGFALLGPLATLWFAALSRQRERNVESIREVFSASRLNAIQRLSFTAILIFFAWNVSAAIIYYQTLGISKENPNAFFLIRVFTTTAGLELMIIGCAVGFVFALITLAISVISVPMVIDRPVTAWQAVMVSLQAVARNPAFVLCWGAVVAVAMALAAIPCLLGFVIVLPVLGHATWHIYRKMVS